MSLPPSEAPFARLSPRPDTRLVLALAAFAAFALGQAVQVANGNLHPQAIGWLTAALVALLVATLSPTAVKLEGVLGWAVPVALVVALGFQFSQLMVTPPGMYVRYTPGWHLPYMRALAFAAVTAGALILPAGRSRHLLIAGLLLSHLALGSWLIHAAPTPVIDVFVFQRDSAQALLQGTNPYAITFPNIYGHGAFYGPGLVVNGRLAFGYPYPPLSLLFSTLSQALGGDVRYAQLVAMTATGGLLAYLRPGRFGALAAALYLFTPRSLFVLEQSWTEPFVVLFLAATVFCAVRCPRALPYALGAFLAVKQYAVLAVPVSLLLLGAQARLRDLVSFWGRAAAVTAALVLPLALWDPPAFWHSVVALQFFQPFRADALTYLGWFAGPGGAAPSGAALAFVGALVAAALALWRAPRSPAGFALGTSLVFILFFALNKQAFCNYYFFVIGACCTVIAALQLEPEAGTTGDRAQPEPSRSVSLPGPEVDPHAV
ncbi:MAG: hypothetical protein M3Y59_19270 [Myxococcota bacterium]|nr:hypothetical protein [Myxococcota bacterium]